MRESGEERRGEDGEEWRGEERRSQLLTHACLEPNYSTTPLYEFYIISSKYVRTAYTADPFHLFYIRVAVVSNVNICYTIYIFRHKRVKDDFRSVFEGKACTFRIDKFYCCLFIICLPFKLEASFAFLYTLLDLAKLSRQIDCFV
jgi:hypothetical protein